jgi:hypoxanthine phosphoribosyltransferase
MNYRNLQDLSTCIRKNLKTLPTEIDAVVGIPRSGMIAASMIATLMNKPLGVLNHFARFGINYGPRGLEGEADRSMLVLLVDDSISGGETMQQAEKRLRAYFHRVVTLAVYRKVQSPMITNYTFETVPGPRVFEWNWHRHHFLKTAMLDIDGVICHDPTEEDLENEQTFRRFVINAKPLFLPRYRVPVIATGRKTQFRELTEMWLEHHGVKYDELYMSTPERGAKRTKLYAFNEARFSEKRMRITWIVESNGSQAKFLRQATGLPVLCTDNNAML